MKNKVIYILVYGLFKAFAMLPFGVLYVISDAVYFLLYRIAKYRVKVVRKNIANSFPQKSEAELRSIERRFYHHLCDVIFETLKLLHISTDEIKRRAEVVNGDLVEQIAADGRSFILFLGHYCNWEWVQTITYHFDAPKFKGAIYKPQRNEVFNKIMLKIRSRFELMDYLEQDKAVRSLIKMKVMNQQFMYGFISDQRPNSSENNLYHWTTFLNQDTPYVVGGEEIGKKINAHYLFLEITKKKRGYYRLEFKPVDISGLENEPYPYSLRYMQMMQSCINAAPQYWLWSHNRWKYKKIIK